MADLPTPGSTAALHQGCRCPQVENRHGRGHRQREDGAPVAFLTAPGCPLHGPWYEEHGPAAAA